MQEYIYEGPVKEFGKVINYHWRVSTFAVSEHKARCNLAYRYKKEHNRVSNANITLPGKLEMVS